MTSHKDKKTGKVVRHPVIDPQAEQIAKAAAEREARKAALEASEAAKEESADTIAANSETGASEQAEPNQSTSTLDEALGKVSGEYVAPSAEQISEMLTSDAALKSAVEAFQALTMDQREKFSQITGLKSRKTAEKKVKTERDRKELIEAKAVFECGLETLNDQHFGAIASAKLGIIPPRPSFADKKAEIYHQVMKSKSTKNLFAAIDKRDLEDMDWILATMTKVHTANRVIYSYGRLCEIAIKAQNAQNDAEKTA